MSLGIELETFRTTDTIPPSPLLLNQPVPIVVGEVVVSTSCFNRTMHEMEQLEAGAMEQYCKSLGP
ncbi:hypothetical protein Sjap_004399 [Stephania japonica]|uniref:Uncharacterized protein n=1 Tax=Stephania japonica TaxID=461633 RepID=A0AAP0K270_9MAGN